VEVWCSECLLQDVTALRVEIIMMNEGDSILYLSTAVNHIVYRLAWEEEGPGMKAGFCGSLAVIL